MDAIVEAVTVFPSEAHGSIPVLREVHVVQSWVFCVIFIRLNGQCIVCSSSNCFWLPLLITPSDYHFWLPLLITPSVASTLSFDGCLGESLLWGRHIETVEVFSASNNIPFNWFVSFTTRYGWFTYNKPYVRYTNV